MADSTSEQPAPARCDMVKGCPDPITHLDTAGYVYCTRHGLERRQTEPCRKLRDWERRRLARGLVLTRY